jgi:hypothetical protein
VTAAQKLVTPLRTRAKQKEEENSSVALYYGVRLILSG